MTFYYFQKLGKGACLTSKVSLIQPLMLLLCFTSPFCALINYFFTINYIRGALYKYTAMNLVGLSLAPNRYASSRLVVIGGMH